MSEHEQPDRTDRGASRGPDDSERNLSTPALSEVEGHEGFPATLVDTDHNMPGDQPTDARGPNKSELEGTD